MSQNHGLVKGTRTRDQPQIECPWYAHARVLTISHEQSIQLIGQYHLLDFWPDLRLLPTVRDIAGAPGERVLNTRVFFLSRQELRCMSRNPSDNCEYHPKWYVAPTPPSYWKMWQSVKFVISAPIIDSNHACWVAGPREITHTVTLKNPPANQLCSPFLQHSCQHSTSTNQEKGAHPFSCDLGAKIGISQFLQDFLQLTVSFESCACFEIWTVFTRRIWITHRREYYQKAVSSL